MPPSEQLLTTAVLVGLLLALVLWIVRAFRRSYYDPPYAVIHLLNILFSRCLWRTEVLGGRMLPEDHGAVIVCNHRSSVDPLFIQLASRPVVSWMVAAEYFQWPVFGTLLRFMKAIPTRRGGIDTASTRTVIRRAAAGGLVGMLPEGRINDTSVPLLPARGGAVLVAQSARVPIIPCHIHGAPYDGTVWGCFFMPARVRLIVGEPIDLSPYYDQPLTRELQAELTLRMMRAIAWLGGDEDFEPVLAGRNWKPIGSEDES